ncbi:MAG: TlpA family protein disulfide reductase [Desulfarculaceae bacterium]|nr:TlpA family protein disulfide reductase [Desulfarculaceae bacterium]MCF8073977.1 TlpA family protein disulfide reductase [Desulfarculaceae bacterium]MCF8102663.1 TlpA family protein disulfide reductase [Desulfarculaceae bacterium]MCF8116096.1 TlpA family protein disulfide reductase [Desulfarculaceae bacterium]
MAKALSALIFCLSLFLCLTGAQAAPPPALSFDLPTLDGGNLSLEQFRGRVVVVEFFATWCKPCRRALPKLDKFAKEYAGRGVSAIAFSVDQGGRQVVKPFVARLGLQMPVVLGDVKWAQANAGVRVLPTTLIIDPQGKVVHRYEGPVSRPHLMAAVGPYLAAARNPQPKAARTQRRQPGESRFLDLWVTGNEVVEGHKGLFVHLVADVADQRSVRGLWLALNIQGGSGPVKRLYMRIDDVSLEYFVMFVRCDQLPALVGASAYRAQVSILDSQQRVVESSPEFPIAAACGVGGQYAARTPEPKKFSWGDADSSQPQTVPATPPAAPPAPAPQTGGGGEATQVFDVAQGRIKGVAVSQNHEFEGKPGVLFRVKAELGDLPTDKGLWLAVNLWPEDSKGRGLVRGGEPESLYHRVDSTFLDDYLLFVRCDQFPEVPTGGRVRVWFTVLIGPQKNVLARSKEFVLTQPCRLAYGSQ